MIPPHAAAGVDRTPRSPAGSVRAAGATPRRRPVIPPPKRPLLPAPARLRSPIAAAGGAPLPRVADHRGRASAGNPNGDARSRGLTRASPDRRTTFRTSTGRRRSGGPPTPPGRRPRTEPAPAGTRSGLTRSRRRSLAAPAATRSAPGRRSGWRTASAGRPASGGRRAAAGRAPRATASRPGRPGGRRTGSSRACRRRPSPRLPIPGGRPRPSRRRSRGGAAAAPGRARRRRSSGATRLPNQTGFAARPAGRQPDAPRAVGPRRPLRAGRTGPRGLRHEQLAAEPARGEERDVRGTKNEVLCKVLAHNICCLIQCQSESGIEPVFWPQETTGAERDHP